MKDTMKLVKFGSRKIKNEAKPKKVKFLASYLVHKVLVYYKIFYVVKK